jgi:hypothetical protein
MVNVVSMVFQLTRADYSVPPETVEDHADHATNVIGYLGKFPARRL